MIPVRYDDLKIDYDHVVDLLGKMAPLSVARTLGHDVTYPDNLVLAGRLLLFDARSHIPPTVAEYEQQARHLLNAEDSRYMRLHSRELQDHIVATTHQEMEHDWFSVSTILDTYALVSSHGGDVIEDTRYVWMRVAVHLWRHVSLDAVRTCYSDLLEGWYTPSTPTLRNAGLIQPQLASCFLFSIRDTLSSILERGVRDAGIISKHSGGLGVDVSRVRHSEIDQRGMSEGIIPLLQLYNSNVRYCRQQERKGAMTVFLRPHHIDVEDFVRLPSRVGDRYLHAHDLNICLWTPWLFWQRIIQDDIWTLFCPAKTPQLNDVSGAEWTSRYIDAELDLSIPRRQIRARSLYDLIVKTQIETGMPYLMDADGANLKSNHRHLGYIRNSNLCLEIIEYTHNDIAVCNLTSLSLRRFAREPYSRSGRLTIAYDFRRLGEITRRCIGNLNRAIDISFSPHADAASNNSRHRPVGLGASGWAETLFELDLVLEDTIVTELNKLIFACCYWNALVESVQLALIDGAYDSFVGSPASQGKLQFDLWHEEFQLRSNIPVGVRVASDDDPVEPAAWNQEAVALSNGDIVQPTWNDLKRVIMLYGLRNSLVLALAPTATTAQVRRNTETMEYPQSNLYSRQVLRSAYPVINRYMVKDLDDIGLWNASALEYLRITNGSLRHFGRYIESHIEGKDISDNIKTRLQHIELKYRTMWELPQKRFLRLAADRGRYIDQSQSLNIYLDNTHSDGHLYDQQLRACHIYAHWLGLKTMMYYLRSRSLPTIKFTVEPSAINRVKSLQCSITQDGCSSCEG